MNPELLAKYQPVIGLEVHAQLTTESKAYASDSTEYGALPNQNLSVITLGYPGTLPRLNERVVDFALSLGLATNCQITRYNEFARKNYFYPDLPKGYQITQDKTPICTKGWLDIRLPDGSEKRIGITRIHMEEDAGKSMHLAGETETLVDLNRAGVPLLEVVSEPDIRSADEAYAYLTEVRKLVRYLGVCDGNMEEGSLRCDVNVSVMLVGASQYGQRVEVKNLNSFRNVQRAIEHEVERQITLIESGETVPGETRGFDAVTGATSAQRSKETLNDYRYFPEPDLPPVIISDEHLARAKAALPALPHELCRRFTQEFKLSAYDAQVLTDQKETALWFADLTTHTKHYKAASNWVMGAVKSYLNERALDITAFPLPPRTLAALIELIEAGTVSHSAAAKQLFPHLLDHPTEEPADAAKNLGLVQTSDAGALQGFVDAALAAWPDKVADYRAGKKNLLGLFMGEVMKRAGGSADPKAVSALVRTALEG
jgi:aspartyl-tRNA(Asn)/glutamyl-tRNA(Gln) amidotransferase subunit B